MVKKQKENDIKSYVDEKLKNFSIGIVIMSIIIVLMILVVFIGQYKINNNVNLMLNQNKDSIKSNQQKIDGLESSNEDFSNRVIRAFSILLNVSQELNNRQELIEQTLKSRGIEIINATNAMTIES